jgi:hypothetical protein
VLKNVEIASSFIVQNVPRISKKLNAIFVINVFALIVFLMYSNVKNVEIICAKIVSLIALNVIYSFAKRKIHA